MAVRDKAQFVSPGCIVEFLQGNSPTIAYVLDVQTDRVRLYTQNKKEVKLPASRLLPWYGPAASPSLSRSEIDSLLEECRSRRAGLLEQLDIDEIWQLAEGEITKASAGWFTSLVWGDPDIDCEAAMGHALLDHKTHFKFSPPDFEIFTQEVAEKRMAEAKASQLRETLALHGNKFFLKLWEVHLGKTLLAANDLPAEEIALQLEQTLHTVMAGDDSDDSLWKLLTRGLPSDPHLALHLATAWGIVPRHYNFLLDKAGYNGKADWAAPFAGEIDELKQDMSRELARRLSEQAQESVEFPFVSIDPESTIDRDDALFVQPRPDGGFTLHVAIACPSLCWPFGSAFDKEVLRRTSSLYLPEGDLHMLPDPVGCSLFGLDAGAPRLALVTSLQVSQTGQILDTSIAIQPVSLAGNMTLCEAEALISRAETETPHLAAGSATSQPPNPQDIQTPCAAASQQEIMHDDETMSLQALDSAYDCRNGLIGEFPQCQCPSDVPDTMLPHAPMLHLAYQLATVLRQKRLDEGAVILERPDTDIWLTDLSGAPLENKMPIDGASCSADPADGSHMSAGSAGLAKHDTILVQMAQAPSTPKAHLVIGELMIAANAAMGKWANEHAIPLFYRNQDVALPPEYAAVWNQPQDIAKIVRSLPPATLETLPKKHAGLGILAYATCTSPMRRYVDLINQGQITSFLQGKTNYTAEELNTLLPLLQARMDSVGQVQRFRPRYWKLLFFRQQGDRRWWPGIVSEENSAFVTVALPWAQIMVRGRRKLFDEKIAPGASVSVRIGKVHPLENEIVLLEAREE